MFDNSNAIDLIDLHDAEARAQFPALTIQALMEELHVVDDQGRVTRGARAVNEVLRWQHGLGGILMIALAVTILWMTLLIQAYLGLTLNFAPSGLNGNQQQVSNALVKFFNTNGTRLT